MEDEKGLDEKILCVLSKDYEKYNDINHVSYTDLTNIHWFFSNYKNNTPGKWSRVINYQSKEEAIKKYKSTLLK
jgi:inorganic pyrophosphatase